MIFDPHAILTGLGPAVLIGLGIMVFIESGLLFPFLPGDSLLRPANRSAICWASASVGGSSARTPGS